MKYLGKGSVSSVLTIILNICWCILITFTGLLLIGGIIYLFTRHLFPATIHGDLSIQLPGLKLIFTNQTLQLHLVILGVFSLILPILLVGLGIMYQLRKILATLATEKPFIRDNVSHIRWIGFLILASSVVQPLGGFLFGLYVMNHISVPNLDINPSFSLEGSMIFIGFVVLVLAEVFHIGTKLQEDQNLTI